MERTSKTFKLGLGLANETSAEPEVAGFPAVSGLAYFFIQIVSFAGTLGTGSLHLWRSITSTSTRGSAVFVSGQTGAELPPMGQGEPSSKKHGKRDQKAFFAQLERDADQWKRSADPALFPTIPARDGVDGLQLEVSDADVRLIEDPTIAVEEISPDQVATALGAQVIGVMPQRRR